MPDDLDERLEAAAALRDLNHAFVAHDRDAAGLRELRGGGPGAGRGDAARAAAGTGSRSMQAARAAAAEASPLFVAAGPGSGFEDRAVAGRANPTSVDLERGVRRRRGRRPRWCCTRRSRARRAGPTAASSSAVFDDVTGFVIGHLGEPAFTGELTVRFEAPVPVEETLTVRARLDGRERRKLFISAEATAAARSSPRARRSTSPSIRRSSRARRTPADLRLGPASRFTVRAAGVPNLSVAGSAGTVASSRRGPTRVGRCTSSSRSPCSHSCSPARGWC